MTPMLPELCKNTLLAAAVCFLSWRGPAAVAEGAPPGPRNLLIVHTVELDDAAGAWADYRRSTGWRVQRHSVEAAPDAGATRRKLRAAIRRFAETRGPADRVAVLLLGDADPTAIPTWTLPQRDPSLRSVRDRRYATDHPYQVLDDGDDRPAIVLGRIPARTPDEARLVLAKVKRYEQDQHLGPWRRRITYVAGEGRFGPADRLLEGLFKNMVCELVPDAYDVSMTYAKPSSIYCPPPSRLTATVLRRLDEGALLFNYVGHGTARGFDHLSWSDRSVPILDAADLDQLTGEHARLPIALLTCCSAGWYDLPGGEASLGETMLFHPAGPVAVIAGSRPTHPYANVVLQKEITRLLLIDRVETVGALDLLAAQAMLETDDRDRQLDALAAPIALAMQWPTSLPGLRRMHVRLYNLLGDPTLRIALPAGHIADLRLADRRVTGRIDGMRTGRVVITLETDRTRPARDLVAVNGNDDPDLETKAAHNYAIANDAVLARFESAVEDGRFETTFGGDVPPRSAVVKAYAVGTDLAGRPTDAIGALRLPAPEPEAKTPGP